MNFGARSRFCHALSLVQYHAGELVLSHKFHVWKFFFFPMLNSNCWEVGKVRNSNSIFMKVTLGKRLKFQEVNLVSLLYYNKV